MANLKLFLVIILITGCCTNAQLNNTGIVKLNLNADRDDGIWTATGNNGTTDITVPAGVPGGIYSDLDANGILISKIYHDYNDMEVRWVGHVDWSFSRQFTPTAELLTKDRIVLVCEGLDTIADIYVNDMLVGSSQNMFVRYIYDVKEVVRPGINNLLVAFRAPVTFAKEEYDRHYEEQGYPIMPSLPRRDPEERGEKFVQMMRKAQSTFGWDWGPTYASSGIWKNIYIEGFNGAVIRDVLIFTNLVNPSNPPDETDSTVWNLTARVYLEAATEFEQGTLTLRRVGDDTPPPVSVRVQIGEDPLDVSVLVPGSTAKLWWPNGYGDQNLYSYEVSYVSDNINIRERTSKTLRVGFRTVSLVQDAVDPEKGEDWGLEFYFRVNGVQMYSKGSNSIPIHILPERVTDEMTRWLLESAKELHTNMIRVWGGGIYESDLFFDLADELGIFIWEDFMFTCAMYPATDEFIDNVVEEVQTQVKRLQSHPSLAIWAANNENEAAIQQNWYGTDPWYDSYVPDWLRLYVDTIIREVAELDPSRECIPSSPTNGKQSEKEGWIALDPTDLRFGDIHPYNYVSDCWNWEMFKRGRYTSEYGYQSFPYYSTIEGITDDIGGYTWNSSLTLHRQRHPNGQMEIRSLTEMHFPYPIETWNTTEAYPALLYLAQVTQSMCQKTQTEFYRRLMDKLDPRDATGHNMGALYWQLNDIWEGCSWASFEVNGRWKMLANYMRNAFHPILPSPYKESQSKDVVIELVCDHFPLPNSNTSTFEMNVRVYNLESQTPLTDVLVQIKCEERLTSKEVYRIVATDLDSIGCGEGNDGSPCFVYISTLGYEGDIPIPDNFLWLQYLKNRDFIKDPNLRVAEFNASPDLQTFTVTLASDEIAPFVNVNLKQHTMGRWSENGFVMVEPTKVITYQSTNPISLESFIQQFDMISIFDTIGLA